MYRFLLPILLFAFQFSALAQVPLVECATQGASNPHESPKAIAKFFQGRFAEKSFLADSIFYVPVTAHLIHRTDGTGGLTSLEFVDELEAVNAAYIQGGIQFYVCQGINHINDDTYFDYDSDEQSIMMAEHGVDNTINVFVAENASSGGTPVCGYSFYPWSSLDFVVLARSCATNGSTFAHELGHNLGLYHTHDESNGSELVDGSNCDIAGDLVCDTPADPRLSSSSVNSSCQYTGGATDGNGTPYDPDPSNMMSYSRKSCRDHMSLGQQVRAAFHVVEYKNHLQCSSNYGNDFSAVNLFAPDSANAGEIISLTSVWSNDVTVDELVPNVSFYLVGNGQAPIYLMSGPLLVSSTGNYTHGIDVEIPSGVLSGDYQLQATIDEADAFVETNESNNVLLSDIYIGGLSSVSIQAVTVPDVAGTTTGSGLYALGSTVNLSTASSGSEWKFSHWMLDGVMIGSNENLSITAAETATYEAHYTSTIGLKESGEAQFKLFPNPVENKLSLQFDRPNYGSISLLNLQGQVILQIRLNGASTYVVDLVNLSPGVYFIQNAEGLSKRVLKM